MRYVQMSMIAAVVRVVDDAGLDKVPPISL